MKKIVIVLFAILAMGGLVSCNKEAKPSFTESEHEHVFEETRVSPSCTDGYTLYQCTKCAYSYTDHYVGAIGHIYDEKIIDTTCDQYQKIAYSCRVCKYSYMEESEEMGTRHQNRSSVVRPTRYEQGYTVHTCKRCRYTYTDTYTDPVDYSLGLSYILQDGGYYLSGLGSCTDTDIVVPHINEFGNEVVGVLPEAFHGNRIVSVTICGGVNDIYAGSFSECGNLTSVVLPTGMRAQNAIFDRLPSLTHLTMVFEKPISYYFRKFTGYGNEYFLLDQRYLSYADVNARASVLPVSLTHVTMIGTSCCNGALSNMKYVTDVTFGKYFSYIGAGAFENCESLTNLKLPETLTTIEQCAFASSGITEIVIPAGVEKMGAQIFRWCNRLESATLSQGITTLPSGMFLQCSNLKEVVLPESLQIIQEYAFMDCASLSQINIPKNLTEMHLGTFTGCKKLAYVDLSACQIKNIGAHTFGGCERLTKLLLPDGLKEIGTQAFAGCSMLSSLDIGKRVDTFGTYAFQNMPAFTECTYRGTVAQWNAINGVSEFPKNCKVICADGEIEAA